MLDAQDKLRAQFSAKIAHIDAHVNIARPAVDREELDRLVDDFLAQFATTYQELVIQRNILAY